MGKMMNHSTITYVMLGIAIVSEVIGSTFLTKSAGFTKLVPSALTLLFFGIAFYLLSQVVKTMPMGIAYAIWSGVGIVLTALVGGVYFKADFGLASHDWHGADRTGRDCNQCFFVQYDALND